MRWSQAFIPTLRDTPAEAEAVSHRLLVRAGFIRQLAPVTTRCSRSASGSGRRSARDHPRGDGCHRRPADSCLPALHPAEIWRKSGRWEVMGEKIFGCVDRKGADLALGMTHEEIFAMLAAELSSYRDLPQIWYQIQTKFRDEPRPKSGLLRVREFTMKDSYSLDLDRAASISASTSTTTPISGSSGGWGWTRSTSRPPRAPWAEPSPSSSWSAAPPARTGS